MGGARRGRSGVLEGNPEGVAGGEASGVPGRTQASPGTVGGRPFMPRKPLAHAAAGARFTTKRRAYGDGLEGSRAKAGGWPKPDQQDRAEAQPRHGCRGKYSGMRQPAQMDRAEFAWTATNSCKGHPTPAWRSARGRGAVRQSGSVKPLCGARPPSRRPPRWRRPS